MNQFFFLSQVDVLFESDRGFWSGLSSLLQLARRPVILTASDSSIVHNLPVPAYICHFTSASLASEILHNINFINLVYNYTLKGQ